MPALLMRLHYFVILSEAKYLLAILKKILRLRLRMTDLLQTLISPRPLQSGCFLTI